MPVDEFGREIPGPSSTGRSSSPRRSPYSPTKNDDNEENERSAAAEVVGTTMSRRDLLLSSDEPTRGGGSRHYHHREHHREHHRDHRHRGDHYYRDHHHRDRDHHRDRHHRDRDYHRDRDHRDRDNHRDYGRKRTRSVSPSPTSNSKGGGGGRSLSRGRNYSRGGRSAASNRYVDEPMLCQYIWEKEELQQGGKDEDDEVGNGSDGNKEGETLTTEDDKKMMTTKQEQQQHEDDAADESNNNDIVKEGGDKGGDAEERDQTAAAAQQQQQDKKKKAVVDKKYASYRHEYCLNYIRSFFNEHLDDEWFRQLHSPLERKRVALQERERAALEAAQFYQEMQTSLEQHQQQQQHSSSSHADNDTESGGNGNVCSFVKEARLGHGVKEHNQQQQQQQPGGFKRDSTTTTGHHRNSNNANANAVPKSHMFSMLKRTVHIMDVPPEVSDSNLLASLAGHMEAKKAPSMKIYSSSVAAAQSSVVVGGSGSSGGNRSSGTERWLLRDAYIVLETTQQREELLHNLSSAANRINNETEDETATKGSKNAAIPKRDLTSHHYHYSVGSTRPIPLDIDTTDPYGRMEQVHSSSQASSTDGGGGGGGDGGGDTPDVSPRHSTVYVNPVMPLSIQTQSFLSSSSSSGRGGGGVSSGSSRAAQQQPVVVLSAAVSSQERIGRDRDAALQIARALDVRMGIPNECRLDAIMEELVAATPGATTTESSTTMEENNSGNNNATGGGSSGDSSSATIADQLDVSIAYLRRVHLLSFYNGCTTATRLGDVLSFHHPSSTIHLRLQGADEYVRMTKEENDGIYGDLEMTTTGKTMTTTTMTNSSNDNEDGDGDKDEGGDKSNSGTKDDTAATSTRAKADHTTDLLVMRLDESIARALEESDTRVSLGASGVIVSEQVDAQGDEIEELEDRAEVDWLQHQSLIDQDGRARCAFSFCRKLFKDESFLRKHLMKKHSEYLRAEKAKCHDDYMMQAWDHQDNRSVVPPVLVDCGANFGLVESAVTGQKPTAQDPEPALWEREKAAREERMAAQEERHQHGHHHNHHGHGHGHGQQDHQRQQGNKPLFQDVDDMEDIKVEISFHDVVVAPPPKKKKKKKKLL